jgi:hypothetical protein
MRNIPKQKHKRCADGKNDINDSPDPKRIKARCPKITSPKDRERSQKNGRAKNVLLKPLLKFIF